MNKNRVFVMGGLCAIVGLSYVAGTKRGDPVPHARAETAAPAVSAAALPPTPAPPAKERGPFDMSGLDGLGTKLSAERANAGKSDPNASAVFAAIEGQLKIRLSDKMQPLGSPVGAQYCERMSTKNDVYVVVCEFADEETAKAGQKKAMNTVVKRRDVLQKRASTCAVHQVGDTKEAEDEAKRIKDLIRSL